MTWNVTWPILVDVKNLLYGEGADLTAQDAAVALRALADQIERNPKPGLAADPAPHAAWFQDRVEEALADPRPSVPHGRVIRGARALIEAKRQTQP
jgi:DNA-damage-inducible protein J